MCHGAIHDVGYLVRKIRINYRALWKIDSVKELA